MVSGIVERRLAAILSADAVGYSGLMARNEEATLRTLKAHRDAMDGLIRQHSGRVVDAVGDNLLAAFGSVVDAVACGVGIQRELAARNARLSADLRMLFRIGINLGDVIVDGDQIAGDGVNVAARLEALADPGGITISGAVLEQVEGKLSLRFQEVGEQRLKNIRRPIRVFRVDPASLDPTQDERERASAHSGELSVPGFSGRHAVAVLPFDNLSGDPEQAYFADGLAADLLARLSAFRAFPVIARSSSFVYKGKLVDLRVVSRDLGVRYVVEGSVRKAGERVRVNVQLVDATTGYHVWAEQYDRELSDIFVLQDDITERIVAALVPALTRVETRRVARQPSEDLDAWDCVQRGLWHLLQYTRADNVEARSWARRAIGLHPDSSAAFTILAFSHLFEVIYQWSESPTRSREKALHASEKSVALDPSDSNAHFALGFVASLAGQHERAVAVLQRAIEANPSSAIAHWALGAALTQCGCPDSATPLIEKAIRLSPRDPWMHEFLFNIAAAHFAAERYEEAITFAKRSLQSKSEQPGAYRLLAASYGHLGRRTDARTALDALLRLAPDVSAAQLRVFLPPAIVESYVDGLRKAGWNG